MLKIPPHQVAGHKAGNGKLGPLVDESGRFYKPLQGDERGSNELKFYTSFSSDTRIPQHISKFFPAFYGTQLIEASDGSGLKPHIILQDLSVGRVNPSIVDIKMGSRTWAPEASEEYIQKCLKKDRETSSLPLGFRLSDCAFAATVYGGSTGILSQLLELKAWFEDQTMYHFYSCSILIMFEKELALEGQNLGGQIKLIDFAHVIEGGGVIDHNFLGGLCSLIKFISEILTAPNEHKSLVSSENGVH